MTIPNLVAIAGSAWALGVLSLALAQRASIAWTNRTSQRDLTYARRARQIAHWAARRDGTPALAAAEPPELMPYAGIPHTAPTVQGRLPGASARYRKLKAGATARHRALGGAA
jgi:hypothetical protein